MIDFCEDGTQPLQIWFEVPGGVRTNEQYVCPSTAATITAAPPQVTPALVLTAFRRTPLPASDLVIEPPNGRTLVNFPTNFYTEGEAFTRSFTLLGQQVTLDIRPTTYTWDFGDGETITSTDPGAAYPALDITHTYATEGSVSPSVDTTYEADFRVGNGPTQPVPGTATINGAADTLDIVEARPQLVGSYR